MARAKTPGVKKRLGKKNRQTKWAPFWTVPKAHGRGRVVHPIRNTAIKRNWKRGGRLKV